MIMLKQYAISFKSKILEQIEKHKPQKIAVLVTNEYEGFSSNGGIGTYYTTLSKKFAEQEWDIFLIFCQSEEKFAGKSHIAALKHIFSCSEVEDVLNLGSEQLSILATNKQGDGYRYEYQSVCSLFYIQAIAATFPESKIYIEFPDVNGFGYHTIQAKKANLLGSNCIVGITIHGGFEWVFEANETLKKDDWFNQACYR